MQCQGTTMKGTRCRGVAGISGYCIHHYVIEVLGEKNTHRPLIEHPIMCVRTR